MTNRRYAEDTKVPVSQSTAEVKDLLKRAGSVQTAIIENEAATLVLFVLGGRQYRLTVPLRADATNPAQEERRGWRLMLLLIKAKCEAIREGVSTVEREFMADVVMPNGQTFAEYAEPTLRLAYEKGSMPSQLLLGGPGR
jgi:hypothetical protein